LAHINRLVRAFGLADVAVDALVGNQESHDGSMFKQPWR
jgi:hypothetical protein